MAHQYNNSMYARMAERINKFPQGAPLSDSLFQILRILVSEQEAGLIAQLPIRPFTVATAARIWQCTEAEAQNTLEALASRAMLLDLDYSGAQTYCLPPPMAGFFEFALMRVRDDIDQKALSELFYQYLNVEEDFIKALFVENGTPMGRIFGQEKALDAEHNPNILHVLDYDRASHIIKSAHHHAVGMCYCRHKKEHLGQPCDKPMDICLTLNSSAYSLAKHGQARAIDAAEALDLLALAQENNLVQFGENAREGINFICNCCGCCCEALHAIKRFAIARTIHSNYIAHVNARCKGCGACAKICPMDALTMQEGEGHSKKAVLDTEKCIGCGVCHRACKFNALHMQDRPERSITPYDTVHRVVIMAAEKGTLRELLEDNKAPENHRIMGAVIDALVKAPGPVRDFAVKQLKSRYMEKIIVSMGS